MYFKLYFELILKNIYNFFSIYIFVRVETKKKWRLRLSLQLSYKYIRTHTQFETQNLPRGLFFCWEGSANACALCLLHERVAISLKI